MHSAGILTGHLDKWVRVSDREGYIEQPADPGFEPIENRAKISAWLRKRNEKNELLLKINNYVAAKHSPKNRISDLID